MLTLMESVLCLTAPLAVMYGFHARRNAPERALAWAGHDDTLLMSYSTKFASAMYGPFREAAVASWTVKRRGPTH